MLQKMTNNLQWIISKQEIVQNPSKSRFFCLRKPSFGTLSHTQAPSTCSPWAKLSRFSPTRIDALANWPHGCHGGWWKSKFVGLVIHLFNSYQVAVTWRVIFLTKKIGWTWMWSHIRFAAPQFFSAFIRRLSKIYHKAFQDFSRKRHLAESLVLRELITDGHHLSRSCDRCLNTSTSPLLQQLDACPVGGVLDKNLVATLETWGNERLKVPNLGSQPWNGRMKDGQFLSVLISSC